MRTRMIVSAGIVGAAMLGIGCHKSQPGETTPEASAGRTADTAATRAGAAGDTVAARAGPYGDTAAAAAGAARDSAATTGAAVDSTMGAARDSAAAGLPDTTGLRPDTSGLGAGADSVRRDSM
jgi:hypothetical protein